MNEREYINAARGDLEAAGYHPIQEEAVAGRGSASIKDKGPLSVRADLVGWASVRGELRQVALVEIKVGAIHPDRALAQMRHLANAFGTTDHYLYNGEWHNVDIQTGQVTSVSGPVPAPPTTSQTILRRDAAEALVDERIAKQLKQLRNVMAHGRGDAETLVWTVSASVAAIQEAGVDFEDTALAWAVSSRLSKVTDLFGRHHAEWFGMPEELARAMIRLADLGDGGTLVDPVCGIGTILWAAQDSARQYGHSLSLRGTDINQNTVDIAEALSRLSPVPLHLAVANLLDPNYPISNESADRVVGVPPLGLRLTQPVLLANGDPIRRDGDVAVIDRMLQLVRPGGRVVVQVSRGFLFRGGPTREYRNSLADTTQVQAIIGLPKGLVPGTTIPSALLVVDKRVPTADTLVAELVDDWPEQLGDEGDFMSAFKEHTRP